MRKQDISNHILLNHIYVNKCDNTEHYLQTNFNGHHQWSICLTQKSTYHNSWIELQKANPHCIRIFDLPLKGVESARSHVFKTPCCVEPFSHTKKTHTHIHAHVCTPFTNTLWLCVAGSHTYLPPQNQIPTMLRRTWRPNVGHFRIRILKASPFFPPRSACLLLICNERCGYVVQLKQATRRCYLIFYLRPSGSCVAFAVLLFCWRCRT